MAAHAHDPSGRIEVEDIAWYYPTPLSAVEAIRDLVAFWNERVDLSVG